MPRNGDAASRARARAALRILPYVFLLYVIAYVDRVNVSFASLGMNAELGFTDSAFGLVSGIFYVGYILFEIPGALIVERWSARRWIGRVMIVWGLVTVLTGFVETRGQFYVARLFLGLAEASFFPGMIVYLTRWFPVRDRSRAIACLYAANPFSAVIGSPIAGWLLGTHWPWLAGWRWLFILEGIPAIAIGIVTIFYLTDWPAQARWLRDDERDWLVAEMRQEVQAKKRVKDFTIGEAFRDPRILTLIVAYFLALSGSLGTIYWIPIFVKRMSGTAVGTITRLLLIPAIIGVIGILANGWHSDRRAERRKHAAVPLLAAGLMFCLSALVRQEPVAAIACMLLGSGFLYAYYPAFWSMPTSILSDSAAAATFGLINSAGLVGGLVGPWAVGVLNDRTHSLTASLAFIGLVYLGAGGLILAVRLERQAIAAGGSGR